MKTLIYRLRKHDLPIEDKLKIYSMYYSREMKKILLKEDTPSIYYQAKDQALRYTDRFINIYSN